MKIRIVVSWFSSSGKKTTEDHGIITISESSMEDIVKIEQALNESNLRRYHFLEQEENEID